MSTALGTPRGLEQFAGLRVDVGPGDPLPDVTDRRTGVLGDPAAIVELVPHLVGRAALVKVFLRDPVWVLPANGPVGGQRSSPLTRLPYIGSAIAASLDLGTGDAQDEDAVASAGRAFLRREVPDAWIRRQLTPDRRRIDVPVVRSDTFYASLRRADCELVTWPVATVSEAGVRTGDGLEHRLDVLLVAQGPGDRA